MTLNFFYEFFFIAFSKKIDIFKEIFLIQKYLCKQVIHLYQKVSKILKDELNMSGWGGERQKTILSIR